MPVTQTDNATALTIDGCWEVLKAKKDGIGLGDLKILPLPDFVESAPIQPLTRAEKELILDQAEILFRDLYSHLPFKEQAFPLAKPLLALKDTRKELDGSMSELEFHLRMMVTFASVRDSHTVYTMPRPFRGATAFLPFEIRGFRENGTLKYVVSRVMPSTHEGEFLHEHFGTGVEVVTFGTRAVAEEAEIAASMQPGANPAATLSRGVSLLTLRPLGAAGWPQDGLCRAIRLTRIEYRSKKTGELRTILFPWGVITGFQKPSEFLDNALSMNDTLSCSLAAGRALMNHGHFEYVQWAKDIKGTGGDKSDTVSIVSENPDVFHVQHTNGEAVPGFTDPKDLLDEDFPEKRFAHVRILKFAGAMPIETKGLPDEFKRILEILNEEAPDGLILDIRGNPGGDIVAAELMLQMLTPHKITPCQFHFARTPALLEIMNHVVFARDVQRNKAVGEAALVIENALVEFKSWLQDSLGSILGTDPLTPGHPLTEPRIANDVGQVYKGPVTLLVDARTYSAADIFAAGFQDHGIGLVVGVDPNTGGGGANVWSHSELVSKVPFGGPVKIQKLPTGVGMSVAIRRATRIGPREGMAIEDSGVKADVMLPITLEDIQHGNSSVLRLCRRFLAGHEKFRIEVSKVEIRPTRVRLKVTWTNVPSAVVFLDGVQQPDQIVVEKPVQTVSVKRPRGFHTPRQLVLFGMSDIGELVAMSVVDLQAEAVNSSGAVAGGS